MCEEFTHLHVHTDASLLDGMGTIPNLISSAKRIGSRHIAMTDHGTLANAISFVIECQAQGIKPILGLEGYIFYDGKIGHITLLADGNKGWNSLLALNNLSHKSEYKQPAFTVDQLMKYNEGLLCLTGCIASPFQQLPFGDAISLGQMLKSVFGRRLFAELMFVGDSLSWERPLKLAEKLGIRPLITNDVHFAEKNDAKLHPILTRMKAGFDYESDDLYLKSAQEIFDEAMRFGHSKELVAKLMKNTVMIGDRIQTVKLQATPKLPTLSKHINLKDLVESTTRFKMFSASAQYMDRAYGELKIINEMKYDDYFIILDDIIKAAKERDVRVGPGRGSGAGSLILYFLEITDVDPIKHGLQFERFLNPERQGMPDVDVDIDSENRQRVLDYANDKYGAIPIATYSRYGPKSLIRDLGRSFRIEQDLVSKASDEGENSDAFEEIMNSDPLIPQAYQTFMNQIRHKGKHAGGVIVTDTLVPIERVGDIHASAWVEGGRSELSYAGVVKFDLLGLSILSTLRRLETVTGLKPESWEEDDKPFEIFRQGDLSGIFQFSGSEGIRKLTVELQPEKFDDLVAINALYRPGAIDAGSTALYPEWKKSPRPMPSYIEDITEPTYGAIVFQEQFMEIYRRTVGGTYGEADLARRLIVKAKPEDKKWVAQFKELKESFMTGAQDHGLTKTKAEELFHELETHSRYSFNKAHSAAYAMIAWECAWWKTYHPAEFYAQMLNVDTAQEQTFIVNAVEAGIEVVLPDINSSGVEYVAKDGKIFLPLHAVKFFGINSAQVIFDEREANGEFKDLTDMMARIPKKVFRSNARAGFLALGGFDSIKGSLTLNEIKDIIGLKEFNPPDRKSLLQIKFLGFIVPDKKLLKLFAKLKMQGYTVGMVQSIDNRDKGKGPYSVIKLSPKGVFWTKEKHDLIKGQMIGVVISDKNGRAKTIKLI